MIPHKGADGSTWFDPEVSSSIELDHDEFRESHDIHTDTGAERRETGWENGERDKSQ
jgi:hypothetical protein